MAGLARTEKAAALPVKVARAPPNFAVTITVWGPVAAFHIIARTSGDNFGNTVNDCIGKAREAEGDVLADVSEIGVSSTGEISSFPVIVSTDSKGLTVHDGAELVFLASFDVLGF